MVKFKCTDCEDGEQPCELGVLDCGSNTDFPSACPFTRLECNWKEAE